MNDSGRRQDPGRRRFTGRLRQIFRRNVQLSGIVPQICAILGPTAAAAFTPRL